MANILDIIGVDADIAVHVYVIMAGKVAIGPPLSVAVGVAGNIRPKLL